MNLVTPEQIAQATGISLEKVLELQKSTIIILGIYAENKRTNNNTLKSVVKMIKNYNKKFFFVDFPKIPC